MTFVPAKAGPEKSGPELPSASNVTTPNEFTADKAWARLDRFLAALGTGLTRSQLHRLVVQGSVLLNGYCSKPSQTIQRGDRVSVSVPPPRTLDLAPQWMPIQLVYQDEHVVVIDKPPGLSVHPGPGHPDRTLVNGLLALCPDIQGVGDGVRPGIVHRLDKDTSGLMMVAKNHQAHLSLSAQIKDREVTKGYLALATGDFPLTKGEIDAPIGRDPRNRKRMAVVPGGRESRTNYRVLESWNGYTLLQLYLESGRTHQIRVHLAYLGHPLLGDRLYGKPYPALDRQFLHANHLGFRHPASGENVEFHSPPPKDLEDVLLSLRETAPNQAGG
jgi:23S rRNA pseudouridine1911/1915/1917 synthase